ncbi:hypothetical protein CPC08DRAFT_320906 [Agrocybe pediades]|nr:hypothetical protein CPC08DRAFT_320906 [Agrocybe pediades]
MKSSSGYSGTVTYTRRDTFVPLKAEEKLTGILRPKPPLSMDENISGTYLPVVEVEDRDEDAVDWKDLDSEGRAVVVDLGLFVLSCSVDQGCRYPASAEGQGPLSCLCRLLRRNRGRVRCEDEAG